MFDFALTKGSILVFSRQLKIATSILTVVLSIPSMSISQSELRSVLGGDIRNGFEAAREVNVRNADAMALAKVGETVALRLSLDYGWKGGDLDWRRLGRPGFAQRLQFREKPRKQMRAGNEYWYTASFFLPSTSRTVRGHTLSLMDFKHHFGGNGSVPTVQFFVGQDGNFNVGESLSSKWRCGAYGNVGGGQTAACDRVEGIGVLGRQSQFSGRWVQVVTYSKWSNQNDGVFRLWIDGRPIFGFSGNTLQGSQRVEFKFGPYRHHMTGDPGRVDVYYTAISRSGNCAGLKTVDCDALQASPPRIGFQNVRRQFRFANNELSERS